MIHSPGTWHFLPTMEIRLKSMNRLRGVESTALLNMRWGGILAGVQGRQQEDTKQENLTYTAGLTILFKTFSQGMVPYTSSGSKKGSSSLLWGSVYTGMMLPNTLSDPAFRSRQLQRPDLCHTIRERRKWNEGWGKRVDIVFSFFPPSCFVCFQLLSWQPACVGVAVVTTAVMVVFFISPASTPGTPFWPALSWRHKKCPSLFF